MRAMSRTRRGRCCSICTVLPGTRSCARRSAYRARCFRRSAQPATISARPCPNRSAMQSRLPGGLTADCGLPEIARAALEAVGYQTRDLVAAMAGDAGLAIDQLRVDGGMAVSDWTMQFVADILPATIERPASVETTAWGAAYAAGLTRGLCPEPTAMTGRWTAERRFTPAMPEDEREERYSGWRRAIAGVLATAGS